MLEPFEHEAVVIHRVAFGLRSIEEGAVVRMVELRESVPGAVIARQQKPGLIALIAKHVMDLEIARADVPELAPRQRAGDAAKGLRAGGECVAHLLHPPALNEARQKRRRGPLVPVDLHVIGPQRVDDDQHDVLLPPSHHMPGVRGPQDSVAFGDRTASRRRLEGKAV